MNDTTNQPLKRCVRCGTTKPASPEYFWRDKARKDGYFHTCKACCNTPKQEPENPEANPKQCPRCKKTFPASAQYFYRDKTKTFGLSVFCKACHDAKRSQRVRNFSHEPLRRTTIPVYNAPHVRNQIYAYTKYDWKRCLDYFGGCCAVCGRQRDLFGTLLVVADHWIPVKHPDCPGTTLTNIVPLCHSMKSGANGCNNLKGGRHPEDWLTNRYGKRKAKEILERISQYFAWVEGLPR